MRAALGCLMSDHVQQNLRRLGALGAQDVGRAISLLESVVGPYAG